MIPIPNKLPPPPFNDALYRALSSPMAQAVDMHNTIDKIKLKRSEYPKQSEGTDTPKQSWPTVRGVS